MDKDAGGEIGNDSPIQSKYSPMRCMPEYLDDWDEINE
jgi:hypothetical protein